MEHKVKKYVKNPVVVEAIQWNGLNWQDITSFAGNAVKFEEVIVPISESANINRVDLIIHTLEGDMTARRGDYIIKGVKGEFYPCKADIFDETYHEV